VELLTWWTVAQTAKQLGVSTPTAYRTIEVGRLRAVKTPAGWLVDPASVEDYARTRRPVRVKGEKVAC
jgi:excisionase family DNA binding protein